MREVTKKNIITFLTEKFVAEITAPKITDVEVCRRVGLTPRQVSNYKSRYTDFWREQYRVMRAMQKENLVESIVSVASELESFSEENSRSTRCAIAAALLQGQAALYLEVFWDVEKQHGLPLL